MEGEPLVSVLCVTFNQVKYLARAMDGFLDQQTSFPFEILVNDDCSTDGTTELALSYQRRYPDKVQVVTHEENQYSRGIMPVENFLMPRARGRYVALCEGDDYYTDPTKLQRQFDVMEMNHTLTACVHANENVRARDERRLSVLRFYECDRAVDPADVLAHVQCFSTNSLFMRTDALQDYFASPQKALPAHGDHKLMTYFAIHDGGMWYIDRIMSAYRFLAKNSINRTQLMDGDREALATRLYDARTELLRSIDESTEGVYHEAVLKGIDRMDYEYHKDLRDYRVLKTRWSRRFAAESLPARMDSLLYTYARPLHKLAYALYCRL
ncbi:MAG: glycosyltransferase family A protein [Acidobacteriota bacterium]|nr:glycosyltransferase family A protein [Acidobacteriota bacterium]